MTTSSELFTYDPTAENWLDPPTVEEKQQAELTKVIIDMVLGSPELMQMVRDYGKET